MTETVFLTGATGFVGTQTARRLMARDGLRLVVLVRGKDRAEAAARLERTWWLWPELAGAIGTRVEVLAGDVSLPRLGLGQETYDGLAARVTHIIHSAADLRLDGPVEELRKINVQGSAQVVELALAAQRHHGLARLAHVSTAYVAGRRTGPVPEESLSDADGFSNTYEQTKFEGERLVRDTAKGLPLSIFRPGMIVGDSRTGEIATFNTVYVPLRLYLAGKLPVMPCRGNLPVNVVPVDYVADAIARLTFDDRAVGRTFHLTVPPRLLPTACELLEAVRAWAAQALNVRLRAPVMISVPDSVLDRKLLRAIPSALLSYFKEDRQFGTENTEGLLGPCTMNWKDALPRLLEYGASQGFLHTSGRTAHEQVVFRLQSRTRPVRFHEIAEGKEATRTAADVRQEISRAVSGLRALGVARGDRIAIAGLNGVRYLVLDVALGLCGAVSVPLYYTTPAAEMDDILRSSGSRLLFIGAPGLIPELAKCEVRLPVISFCRKLPETAAGLRIMPWGDFVQLGRGRDSVVAPVRLSDDATLRFTSGTTGRPKGALFRHDQVRWMAQTIASLVPWKARVRPASWLSFLPMSHVVEGILGTYSPWYLPAPVDIWFLEDFRALSSALPRARPSVFFSVPRFYEKLWDSFTSRPLGRMYRGLPDGLLRRLLQPMVRFAVLRAAGLDRCAQLISGSAPASPALLAGFETMGITIHNAYGLTEAPLVTLNRYGANRPGTVGAPLPETQVRIAADGEVLVKGPQVTTGYDERAGALRQPFEDGWLLTGDLGHLEDGSLVLDGRKKDLIVTSYGKNIHPGKIETMLKGIPGIVEAMVIGEGRPFCTALLWARDMAADVDDGIREMNGRLSHPEQIRKWSVLKNDLSIEGGELTGNLKLKRQVILQRLGATIDGMYAAGRESA
ncbi:MAG TPA: AMP-binding protein [Spirochaetia bacterium]|nr:AMP-binding protein [Spirochaetia bacterium]